MLDFKLWKSLLVSLATHFLVTGTREQAKRRSSCKLSEEMESSSVFEANNLKVLQKYQCGNVFRFGFHLPLSKIIKAILSNWYHRSDAINSTLGTSLATFAVKILSSQCSTGRQFPVCKSERCKCLLVALRITAFFSRLIRQNWQLKVANLT